jgi:hypothetical protein
MEVTLPNDPAMFGLDYDREANDLYPTPGWVTEAVIPFLRFHGITPKHPIWEPACGNGKMAEVLRKAGFVMKATDIKDYGYGFMSDVQDFLAPPKTVGHGCIVTNPPYGNNAQYFIQQALDHTQVCAGVVAMLLRNEYDSAKSRVDLFERPFARKVVLTTRPRWIEGSTGAPRHNYAWFIWDWTWTDRPTISYHVKGK